MTHLRPDRPGHYTRAAVTLLATALLAGCKLDSMVFSGDKVDAYVLPGNAVPDSLRRAVTFASGGETLHGFWLRQPGSAPRVTMLLSRGKGDNLAAESGWTQAEYLWQSGFNVLIYDYRGFGRSTGTSEDEKTLAADARAALDFLLTQPGVTLGRVVSYGHSLGSAPAITLAAGTAGIRALVIVAGFSTGQAMAETANPLGIPVTWLLREPMRNTTRIATVRAPVFIMHGEADNLIPVAQGRALYAAAKDPRQLRIVAGAGHDDVHKVLGVTTFGTLLRTFTNAAVP
jgi:fermentation-respiration switch protein FrsA (DUF1100 family)